MPPDDPEKGTGVGSYPPPSAASTDPFGLQTASTASTSGGFVLVAAGEAGATVASALGLGAPSAKVLAAGLSLSALGQVSLFTAGLVLIGLGIVLNVASLVVRRQRARDSENDYMTARLRATQGSPTSGDPQLPPPQ
jgi:hypothetical protein